MLAKDLEPMKVLIVGSAASTHIYRWVCALVEKGVRLHLLTAELPQFEFPCEITVIKSSNTTLGKIASTMRAVATLRNIFVRGKFEILHCHYAGRYGMWGALSGVQPFVLSIWGSDVLINPHKSRFHRALIGWMLRRANKLQSTSMNMVHVVAGLYGIKNVSIIPFGIDTKKYEPYTRTKANKFRIVFIKSLRDVYGLDLLLEAIAKLVNLEAMVDVECLIYGDGDARSSLEQLSRKLRVDNIVNFMGKAPHGEIPQILSNADLAVYPSRSESFGVSALEAMACGCPVILSDAPGHLEITQGRLVAKIVTRNSAEALASAISEVIRNPQQLAETATRARRHVEERYNWQNCVQRQISEYESILAHS
jgi:L-malate glycosyltransferase